MKTFPGTPSGVIFDLDGTLLDTEPLYTEASQRVLDPYGHTYTMALKRKVMGGDSTRSAQITIDEFDLPLSPSEYLAIRETHLEKLFPTAPEIRGAGEYLKSLSAKGIPAGLATSSHDHLCSLKIDHRDWAPIFQSVVCGNDSALTKGKPEPDIFLLCAQRMGIKPEEAIAFEDSRNGILAARAAGMYVVAVESPYTQPEDLADAHMIVTDYFELIS